MHRFAFLTILLLGACGKDPGDTSSGSTTTDPDTTATATTGTSSVDETTASTTVEPTTGEATLTSSSSPTTDSTGPDQGSTSDSTGPDTTTDTTTGVALTFNRFLLNKAAGPCPPDADCDGFIELLAPATLRVEKFGDITDDVTEVQISQDDFDAAAVVFADPELFALLAQDDIICNPPTDIFEDMLVDVDGNVASNTTTGCNNPPLAAARAKANELADKYVP